MFLVVAPVAEEEVATPGVIGEPSEPEVITAKKEEGEAGAEGGRETSRPAGAKAEAGKDAKAAAAGKAGPAAGKAEAKPAGKAEAKK